jgi:hypothetical protein
MPRLCFTVLTGFALKPCVQLPDAKDAFSNPEEQPDNVEF